METNIEDGTHNFVGQFGLFLREQFVTGKDFHQNGDGFALFHQKNQVDFYKEKKTCGQTRGRRIETRG